MQGCEMNSNRLSAPVIFEDSSGCYPVCIKNPDIMDNTTASITGRSLFIIRANDSPLWAFSRRAFNVEGIFCLPIQDSDKSHIRLLVNDDQRLE